MLDEILRLKPTVLLATEKSEHLADDYIKAGVISAKKRDDALHVAIASSEGLDLLVTWNHRHLASDRKKELFNAVNQLAGRDKKLFIQIVEVFIKRLVFLTHRRASNGVWTRSRKPSRVKQRE